MFASAKDVIALGVVGLTGGVCSDGVVVHVCGLRRCSCVPLSVVACVLPGG